MDLLDTADTEIRQRLGYLCCLIAVYRTPTLVSDEAGTLISLLDNDEIQRFFDDHEEHREAKLNAQVAPMLAWLDA